MKVITMMKIPPAVAVPLQMGSDGAIRVGNTRILLELVIYAFRQGETPEGIVDSYPSLTLADVYAVIAYYLNHREEVDGASPCITNNRAIVYNGRPLATAALNGSNYNRSSWMADLETSDYMLS